MSDRDRKMKRRASHAAMIEDSVGDEDVAEEAEPSQRKRSKGESKLMKRKKSKTLEAEDVELMRREKRKAPAFQLDLDKKKGAASPEAERNSDSDEREQEKESGESLSISKMKSSDRKPLISPRKPNSKTMFKSSQKHLKKLFEGSSSSTRSTSQIIISQPLSGYSPVHKSVYESFVEAMLSSTLEFAGLTDADCKVIVNEVRERMSERNDDQEAILSLKKMELINTMKLQCVSMLTRQDECEAAVKIQSRVRGHLVRKTILPILKGPSEVLERTKAYNRKFSTLLDKERQYTQSIRLILEEYLYPIRTAPEPILTAEEENLVFGNVESIALIQHATLQTLERKMCAWPCIVGVAEVYLLHSSLMDLYTEYVRNFDNSQTTFVRLRAENPAFSAFISEANQRTSSSLNSLLYLPLTHLSKLCSLIGDLASASDPQSPAHEAELKAASGLKEVNEMVMRGLVKSDTREAIMNVERRIIGGEQLDLLARNRQYIMDGSLQGYSVKEGEKGRLKTYTLFLFNDMILVTVWRKRKGKSPEGLDLRNRIHMRDLSLCEGGSSAKLSFCLRNEAGEENESYWFTAETADAKDKWHNNIKNVMDRYSKNKVFGDTLDHLLAKQGRQVPSIVTDCCSHLLSDPEAMATEGIFRMTGDISMIYSLRDSIDSGQTGFANLRGYRVHEVAGVLKLWLRQLPEPLMGWDDTFHKLVKLRESTGQDDVQALKGIPSIIEDVKPLYLPTIRHLLKFLFEVSKHSDQNMMTASNLSIVFGPVLARPKIDTIETSLRSPLANQIVMLMILHSSELFPE
eukprot:TRINITY_DN3965_c0_g1_i2.p1 TRINITY_DN3965_c0_g1~~TRINITY_DN3965_c0_g1_i2.p1  ORF type:complete len:802 (+),score=244.61 TRINITY_DN3965_c0_g1_i2:129-2534(+)